MKKVSLLFALSVLGFVAAKAQTTASTNQNVVLTLQSITEISQTATPGLTFTFATFNDYNLGLTNTNASSFNVRSNKAWNVSVKAATANFASAAATPMPAGVLSVKLNGGGAFMALSTTDQALTTGARGAVNPFAVDYRANPQFLYDDGSYTLNVVYTVTQQ